LSKNCSAVDVQSLLSEKEEKERKEKGSGRIGELYYGKKTQERKKKNP